MNKVLWISLGMLGIILPSVMGDFMGIRGAWGRGRRKSWSAPIPLGRTGFMCSNEKDVQNCIVAMNELKKLYGIAFNKARCTRTLRAGAQGRRQCHIKYKMSRHTDFECWATNTPDMSGAAQAKCRAPWGKNLNANQGNSAGALMGQGMRPYGQMMGMSPGMSGGSMGMPYGGMSPMMGGGMSPMMGPQG